MRSSFIISAAFAVVALAAPVPVADPIYKSNGRSLDSDAQFEARGAGRTQVRNLRNDGQAHGPKHRPLRDLQDVEVETRGAGRTQDRSLAEEEDEDVEARAIRNESRDADADPVFRITKPGGAGKRTAEAEPVIRITKPGGGSKVHSKREPEPFTRNHDREAEPEPFTRIHDREAEPEPFTRIHDREAEPEPFTRNHDRSAEPGYHRNDNSYRSAEPEAEPVHRGQHSYRSAEPEPGTARPGGNGVKCRPGMNSNRCGSGWQ